MTTRITIRKPDDWHLHVRDNEMLKSSLPHTAAKFGRAILMPNLVPPVRTAADAEAYRKRAMAVLPSDTTFKPLMTCYLTDDTDPDDVERGFKEGIFTGVKLYPANATTNSAAGVTDYRKIEPVLARMEKIGMRFLIHGEEVDPSVDVFDREAVFIERRLIPMTKKFPGLKIILEHLSSKIGVEYIRSAAPQVGATITRWPRSLLWLALRVSSMRQWPLKLTRRFSTSRASCIISKPLPRSMVRAIMAWSPTAKRLHLKSKIGLPRKRLKLRGRKSVH